MEPQPPITTAPVPTPPVAPQKPKNNSFLIILLSVLLLLATSLAFFFALQTQKLTKQLAQIQSATPSPSPAVVTTEEGTPSPDQISNWKIYTNTKYGFSFKYPNFYQENAQIFKTSDLTFFLAFTSKDYKTESGGPLSGSTLSGSILTISTQVVNPLDFVTKRCDYLKKGSPELECKTTTFSNYPLAVVSSQNPLYKTAFIEKDNNVISLHIETTSQTVINLFDQILSTFHFLK